MTRAGLNAFVANLATQGEAALPAQEVAAFKALGLSDADIKTMLGNAVTADTSTVPLSLVASLNAQAAQVEAMSNAYARNDVAPVPTAANFSVDDLTTNTTTVVAGDPYIGPVSGLDLQYINITSDNLNITAKARNVFIHSGSGTDAIDVSATGGTNVLDGSTGSNFLTGGSGNDTFFLDDRSPAADVFSTVVGFHAGDNATVFGVNPTDFTVNKLDNQGAPGFTGLDFAFSAPGHANANFVLAGFTTADLSNGRLTTSYGTTPDTPGAPGSQYLLIHAN
jgi:Ca2+-binding RTX toxin-like protein